MKRLNIIIIVLLAPMLGMAQERLTLEKCLELAKSNHKRIEAADFQLQSARYEKRATFAHYFPTFSITGNGLYATFQGSLGIEDGMLPVIGMDGLPTGASAYFPGINLDYRISGVYHAGVQFQQPLFMGGKITAGYKMGKLGEALASQSRRLTESEVIYETAQAYTHVVRASEICKVATSYNNLLTELKHSVGKAFDRGVKSRNDALKVEVKLNESKLNLQRAENALRLATMNLCHYIGYPLTAQIAVDNSFETTKDEKVIADISLRPEVQLLSQKSELMRQKVNMARAEMLPQLGLFGQYGYTNGLKLNGSKLFNDWNFLIGMQLSIPIGNWSSHAKYRSAQMQYKQSQAEESEKLELMELEVTQAINNLDEAALELRLAESGCASATENLRVSSIQYSVGKESLTNYLEAQTLWLQAEQTLVDAKINQYLRLLEYKKKSGTLGSS